MPMRSLASTVFALVILTAVGFAVHTTFSWVASLDEKLLGPIIAAFLGLFGVILAQYLSKSREIAENHRPSKIEIYNNFFEIVDEFMTDAKLDKSKLDEGILPKKLEERMRRLNRGMIVWASPEVVNAWLSFKKKSGKSEGFEILYAVDDVLRAIRKDLGNSNFGLSKGDLVRNYLSDPEELQ
jgi:hypothetical protein